MLKDKLIIKTFLIAMIDVSVINAAFITLYLNLFGDQVFVNQIGLYSMFVSLMSLRLATTTESKFTKRLVLGLSILYGVLFVIAIEWKLPIFTNSILINVITVLSTLVSVWSVRYVIKNIK
jgi:hypothetical protein